MIDTTGCRGCDYWRTIGWHGGSGQARRACHYSIDTGHCRSLICGTGFDCKVRSEKGVIKLRQPTHKYDSAVTKTKKLRYAPEEQFHFFYRRGLFDEEIAEKTGSARSTVAHWRQKMGHRSNRWKKNRENRERKERDCIESRSRQTEDPCQRCYSAEVCRKVGGTCNEKERWGK